MARVVVVMDVFFEGIDELTDEEKAKAIAEVLDSGAESTCSSINLEQVIFYNELEVKICNPS